MKTCLVTGGAGFIGSHLVDRLIQEGYRVVVIDNESTGFRENVHARAIYLKGDITNLHDLKRCFSLGIDVVFHIAGQTSTIRSFDDPLNDLMINVVGTINILKMCLKYKVPRLMYASSMTVYGHPRRIPVSETESCKPISYYGITKYAAERYIHATAGRTDLGFDFIVTSFRMFNVYGERQSLENPYQGVISIFISNILKQKPIIIYGDGEQSRDFVYVHDVVNAWMAAIDNEAAYGQVFNLGTGIRRSINEIVDVILSAFNLSRNNYPIKYAPPRQGDQRHMVADITKTTRLLRWQPLIEFNEGMERTIRWAVEKWGKRNENNCRYSLL
jgi:UDP-glucose 4-epimerase